MCHPLQATRDLVVRWGTQAGVPFCVQPAGADGPTMRRPY